MCSPSSKQPSAIAITDVFLVVVVDVKLQVLVPLNQNQVVRGIRLAL